MKNSIVVAMLAIMVGWGAVNVLVPEVVAQEVDDNAEDDTNTSPEQVPQCYECPCTPEHLRTANVGVSKSPAGRWTGYI